MKGIKGVKIRVYVMAIIFALAIVLIVGRLGYLQLIKGEGLKVMAAQQFTKDVKIAPKRGRIYDRNNKILATTIKFYDVGFFLQDIDKTQINKYSQVLGDILGVDQEYVAKQLQSNKKWVLIKKWVEDEKVQILKDAKIKGVTVDEKLKRYYPRDNFAAQIIGNTNNDLYGEYGVERSFEEYLGGIPGRCIKFTDRKGNELPYGDTKLFDSKEGEDIVLTIDERIQYIAEMAAQEALINNTAKRVSITIMDPNNAKVLAMANKPDYNPNSRQTLTCDTNQPWLELDEEQLKQLNSLPWSERANMVYSTWKNFSISGIHEPGSVFKLITWASAIEESIFKKNEKFMCDGYIRQVPGNIKCWRYYNPHGEQTAMEGFGNSCNEVSAALALRLKKDTFYKYIKAFGFGKKTGIDLPGEEAGLVQNLKNINDVELTTMSFGQGISVTPIQMLNSFCAVVNGGNLMKPSVVQTVKNREGKVIKEFKPEIVKKVISKETSDIMREYLQYTVEEGSGKKAFVQGCSVGGKTGTAQKIVDGAYKEGFYIASFIGVAPVENPKIAILVSIDEPQVENYHGGVIAAPVAGEVIQKIMNYLNN